MNTDGHGFNPSTAEIAESAEDPEYGGGTASLSDGLLEPLKDAKLLTLETVSI